MKTTNMKKKFTGQLSALSNVIQQNGRHRLNKTAIKCKPSLSIVHTYPCILMNVKIESHGTVTGGRPSSPLDLPH